MDRRAGTQNRGLGRRRIMEPTGVTAFATRRSNSTSHCRPPTIAPFLGAAISTPSRSRRLLTGCSDTLRSGKHLLLEKPLAMNAIEAEEIVAAAAETKATTMINFEFRYTPQHLQVKQFLDEGYVGEVQHASIEVLSDQALRERGRTWRSQASMGDSPQG